MLIHQHPSGPYSTNAYIVACESTREAAIIDPAPNSSEFIHSYLTQHQLHCHQIWLTHSHWDHIGDVHPLKVLLNAQVFIHPLDLPNLEKPGADGLPFMVPITPTKADFQLKDGDILRIGSYEFKVIHTPGNSVGSVCFYNEQNHVLFSGDTLFKGCIGNLSFPTSDPDKMWPSLKKLGLLPPETVVYPGHGNSTTLRNESWLSRAEQLFKNFK